MKLKPGLLDEVVLDLIVLKGHRYAQNCGTYVAFLNGEVVSSRVVIFVIPPFLLQRLNSDRVSTDFPLLVGDGKHRRLLPLYFHTLNHLRKWLEMRLVDACPSALGSRCLGASSRVCNVPFWSLLSGFLRARHSLGVNGF